VEGEGANQGGDQNATVMYSFRCLHQKKAPPDHVAKKRLLTSP
jgi:hypothetical protein